VQSVSPILSAYGLGYDPNNVHGMGNNMKKPKARESGYNRARDTASLSGRHSRSKRG
jgi:hypothetical protein